MEELRTRNEILDYWNTVVNTLDGGTGNYELLDISLNGLCGVNWASVPLELMIIVRLFPITNKTSSSSFSSRIKLGQLVFLPRSVPSRCPFSTMQGTCPELLFCPPTASRLVVH